VAKLIEGYETPYGMELLSTVHWVARHEGARELHDALEKTYAWNDRKKMFKPEHVRIAWDALNREGWVEPTTGRG
jgi:hypothetical protein